MEPLAPIKSAKIKRWLPYWAVFQADFRQTLQSWVYRFWVLLSVLAAVGYLLYRFGISHEAGIVQPASKLISDLLRWSVLGSVALIIALTGGSISSERGIMADSVLSRGISRYQYFLGKWHARLVAVVVTFLIMGLLALAGSFFLFNEDLNWGGSLMALLTLVAFLAVVATCGVTVSAISNSTVLGIAVLWLALYGVGFALSLLPAPIMTPVRVLDNLPNTLRGYYDIAVFGKLIGWSMLSSMGMASIGLVYFSRRDV
jgi:ABC-type transport system involved in multi-copper enzyme maturation permease subunit